MKNNLIKIYASLICFLISVSIFAVPGTGSDTGDLEDGDVAAPIDTTLYVLAILGIALAAYSFLKKRQSN